MPEWLQALAGDPRHADEAQRLWREHQGFRAAFASAEEARAVKELLPGGAQEVLALRQAAQEVESLREAAREVNALREETASLRENAAGLRQAAESVDRIDAAIFSGDARAQSEVVVEMAQANPAAFRSLFAEAAKVLAGMGQGGRNLMDATAMPSRLEGQAEAYPTGGGQAGAGNQLSVVNGQQSLGTNQESQVSNQQSLGTNQESQVSNQQSRGTESQITSQGFDAAAYASFERTTNDTVGREVRGSITDTLARVLPEGVAEGAARRIGEDIFSEVHRALAADRALSEQVGEVLRDRRFGGAEQQRVAGLLAGRARQIVPSVARRVIGEWTSTVLGTARSKAARQAAAASRVDIAAAGGSLDSMPLRAMSAREVDYASMSDDEILGM